MTKSDLSNLGAFGRRLRELRDQLGVGPSTVATAACCTVETLLAVERGERFPPHPLFFKMRAVARLFGEDESAFEHAGCREWERRNDWPPRVGLAAANKETKR